VKTLFLAWQAPNARQWFPIGRLDLSPSAPPAGLGIPSQDPIPAPPHPASYTFRYTQGVKDAVRCGFHPLASFPRLGECYRSDRLFPMFQNRVLVETRKGFAEYLQSLALETNDPMEILAITGGERQTDNFEVFPRIEKLPDDSFTCRFFLHGWRHMPKPAQERAMRLQPGEGLGIAVEMNNPATGIALLLLSRDYEFLGWTPRYLAEDLFQAVAQMSRLPQAAQGSEGFSAQVVHVNAEGVPANRRVLIEFKGYLPQGYVPMAGEPFQPYAETVPYLPSPDDTTHSPLPRSLA